MDNLVEMIKGVLGREVTARMGGVLGESPEDMRKAVDVGIPAILGGMIKKVSDPDGQREFGKQLDDHDGALLEKLDDLLGEAESPKREEISRKGAGLLEALFGGDLGVILDLLQAKLGINLKSVGSVLALIAPIIMSFLSRERSKRGLDLGGLVKILMGQKDLIGDLLPEGMEDLMGLGKLNANPDPRLVDQGLAAAQTVRETAQQTIRETSATVKEVTGGASQTTLAAGTRGKSLLGRSLPILILIAAALAIAKYFQIRNAEQPQPRPMVEEVLPADPDLVPQVELPEASAEDPLELSTEGNQE